VTALIIIALVWAVSAALVVPYLLYVASVEVEQASSQSQKKADRLPGEYLSSLPGHESNVLAEKRAMPQIGDPAAQLNQRKELSVHA
jgi:hypothetical protein